MKRFTKTFVAAMMVVATGAVIMVGCKKEESAQMERGVAQTEQSMSPEEQKVLDFLADYDAMKQGMKAEGEPVCPEDARWYIETSMNYCHGFSHELLSNMRMDTVRVAMPKTDEEGQIAYSDLMTTYGNAVAAVREQYKSIDMEGKTLQFVMMSIENSTAKDGGEDLVILMNTGSNSDDNNTGTSTPPSSPWYAGSFVEGDDWIWGMNKGKCDGSVSISDAAKQLTLAIRDYDVRHWLEYVPCYGCHPYFIIEPTVEEIYVGNVNSTWPFYASGLTWNEIQTYCIPWEDMNMYYEEILQATHTENMITNPFGYYGYYETLVFGTYGVNLNTYICNIWHTVWVYYAKRGWRTSGEYPVPVDEEV